MKHGKSPAAALSWAIHEKYPNIKETHKKSIGPGETKIDTTSLIESPLRYDKDAKADIVIKDALLFGGEGKEVKDVAISGNVIIKVGNSEEIKPLITDKTKIFNAGRKSVLPGFTDSHLHLSVAAKRLHGCNIESVKKADEFKEKVREYAQKNKQEPVLHVFGLHYFEPPIIPAGSARHFLDQIIKDKPLLVFAHDLHTCWANTKAIELAGLLHEMPPFPHFLETLDLTDKFILGSDKIPSGEFHEPEVYFLVTGPLAAKFPKPVEEQLADLEKVCYELARKGITGVHRMGLTQPEQDISFLLLILELQQRGRLPVRISTSCSAVADTHMFFDVWQGYLVRKALAEARRKEMSAADLHDYLLDILHESASGRAKTVDELIGKEAGKKYPDLEKANRCFRDLHDLVYKIHVSPHKKRENPHRKDNLPKYLDETSKVRCNTIKIFMDGVIERGTAYRLDQKPAEGIPEFDQKNLDSLLELADRLGIQVATHSIADASVRSVLDAISRSRRKHQQIDKKRGHRIRHRIEHIEMCKEEDIKRFGKEDVTASMQPLHEQPPFRDSLDWNELVPRENWDTAYAWKQLWENGAVLVFGSDWPIVSCDARVGTNHAVTRKPWLKGGRRQNISVAQALYAYTCNAAFTEYAEKRKGSIKPGMLADLVVLSGDFSKLGQERPPKIDILMTICDGEITYRKENFK